MATQIDDKANYISLFSDVCTRCAHFDEKSPFGMRKTCKAFPDGIPPEIWLGEETHQKPFPGDRGIQFKLHPDARPLKR